MIVERPALERRVLAVARRAAAAFRCSLGGCGTGRTSSLLQHRERLGERRCQYLDVAAAATTPERCLRTVLAAVAVQRGRCRAAAPAIAARGLRRADRVLRGRARPTGGPVTFLLDEILDVPHVRELPGLAPRAARAGGAARREPDEPLRARVALHRARASPAARRAGARSRSCTCRRSIRDDARDGAAARRAAARRATTSCRPCTRSPAGAPGTCRRLLDALRGMGRATRSRAGGAAVARWPAHARAAARATSSACIARAATARSRPSSASSPRTNR